MAFESIPVDTRIRATLSRVDDIHIPTIHRLHTFLLEDDMFELARVERTTAFFRRTSAPAFYAFGDGWNHQKFNVARFPADPGTPDWPLHPTSGEPTPAAASAAELQARVTDLEREAAWWKYVAEERRLKRRLRRLLKF